MSIKHAICHFNRLNVHKTWQSMLWYITYSFMLVLFTQGFFRRPWVISLWLWNSVSAGISLVFKKIECRKIFVIHVLWNNSLLERVISPHFIDIWKLLIFFSFFKINCLQILWKKWYKSGKQCPQKANNNEHTVVKMFILTN